jgi:lysozyme family protein
MIDFIAQDIDRASSWSSVPALAFFFRDCLFNRGKSGAARIVQRALGVKDDGAIDPKTREALAVKGCVRELVAIAHSGAFTGAGISSRTDGMHFEVAFVK